MIRISYCLTRKAGLSHEEFARLWCEHVPLVRRHASALAIERYVQVHTVTGDVNDRIRSARRSPPPFDGIAETWYTSLDGARRAGASEAGRRAWQALLEDELRFIELPSSPIFFGEEHEIRLENDDGE